MDSREFNDTILFRGELYFGFRCSFCIFRERFLIPHIYNYFTLYLYNQYKTNILQDPSFKSKKSRFISGRMKEKEETRRGSGSNQIRSFWLRVGRVERTVINRFKNYCFSIRVARREVSVREERVGGARKGRRG